MYFSYTISYNGQVKSGNGIGVIKGSNKMVFTYMTGQVYGTFTWKNSGTIQVVGTDKLITHSTRNEILTVR